MKYLVVCVLFSLAAAAPTAEDAKAKILNYENKNDGQGKYEFSYETSNGIERIENGELVNVGQSDEHLEVRGLFSYTDTSGKNVIVYYTADEKGFHILPPPEISYFTGSQSPPHLVATLLG